MGWPGKRVRQTGREPDTLKGGGEGGDRGRENSATVTRRVPVRPLWVELERAGPGFSGPGVMAARYDAGDSEKTPGAARDGRKVFGHI